MSCVHFGPQDIRGSKPKRNGNHDFGNTYFRVVEWLEDRLLEDVREERIFIWGLISTDQGLQSLLLPKRPIK